MNYAEKKTYSINLIPTNTRDGADNYQTTTYSNFQFNSIVRLGNKYYGFNESGMYEIAGQLDDGMNIQWSFKTHLDNFGTVQLKTPRYAYLGGRVPADCEVLVGVGEDEETSYMNHTLDQSTASNARAVLGRGYRSNFYSYGVSGNCKAQIDSLMVQMDVLSRGIK